MKKLLVILCLAIASCEQPTSDSTYIKELVGNRSIYTYNIDGCEYIGEIGGDGRNDILTHKGNCKNPIHYGIQNR
jgi:hypothetical protein